MVMEFVVLPGGSRLRAEWRMQTLGFPIRARHPTKFLSWHWVVEDKNGVCWYYFAESGDELPDYALPPTT